MDEIRENVMKQLIEKECLNTKFSQKFCNILVCVSLKYLDHKIKAI